MQLSFLNGSYFLLAFTFIAHTKYLLIRLSDVAPGVISPEYDESGGFRAISYDYGSPNFGGWYCKDGNECRKAFRLQGVASIKERFCEGFEEYQKKCPVSCGLCGGIGYEIWILYQFLDYRKLCGIALG